MKTTTLPLPQRIQIMKRELKFLLRSDFLAFVRKAILELEGPKLSSDPYLEYLAAVVEEFLDGPMKRLLANLPPRHIKTLLIAVCLAAWRLAHCPTAKIMIVTY